MKRKNHWPSRRGRTRGRQNFDWNDEEPGSFGPKQRYGDGEEGDLWSRRRPLQAYEDGHSSYDNMSRDIPSWHRERFLAVDGGKGWPKKDKPPLEQPQDWGYGEGMGYGGGYGSFASAAPGYGSGYGGFAGEHVEPQLEAGSPTINTGAFDLMGKAPPLGLLPKIPVEQGPTPYELMKRSQELKARAGGDTSVTRRRKTKASEGEFDLCWEYNTPEGCQRPNCMWRHEPYIEAVPYPETEEDKSKRDHAMLEYFQKIDQVTKAHQVAPSHSTKPVVQAPQSHLLDEPMDVINNEPVNNEPVINEPINNEPLVASFVPPPIPPKFKSVVAEKPIPKAPTIIRAPANVVTISPSNVANVAPPIIAPDLAPEKEETKPDSAEKKPTKEKRLSAELKKKKPSSKSVTKIKPITKGKCCLLCRRRFKSIEMLKKHIKESELHRKNLKLRSINRELKKSDRKGVEGSIFRAYS